MNQERSQAYFTEILFHLTDRLFQEMHIHLFFKKESKIQSGWGLCLKLQKYLHINKMTYLNSGPQWWYNTEWQVEKERMVAISGTIIGYRFEVLRCIWRRGTGIEEAVLYWPDDGAETTYQPFPKIALWKNQELKILSNTQKLTEIFLTKI